MNRKYPELGNLTFEEYNKAKKSVYANYKEPEKPSTKQKTGMELLTKAMWYRKNK